MTMVMAAMTIRMASVASRSFLALGVAEVMPTRRPGDVAIQQASAVWRSAYGQALPVAELMGFAAASGRGGWRHAGAGC